MRQCSNCKIVDRPVIDFDRPCRPELCSPGVQDNLDPSAHADGCPKVIHEVRHYFEPVKLIITPKHPEGELPYKYQREGWKLRKDGRNLFRWKMLCRNCIEKEAEREMVHRDYLKACKAARRIDDRTYGQLMIQQGQS